MSEKKPEVSTAKKGKLKKTILHLSSIVLVAVVAVLITLAYLGTNSNKEVNTFLGSDGIQLELKEEEWTKKTTPGPNVTEGPSEKERAEDYTPGQEYKKNPNLTNTSSNKDYEEWVAIKVHFDIGLKQNGKLVTGDAISGDVKPASNWGTFSKIADIISDNTTFNDDGTIKTGGGFNIGAATVDDKWTLIATTSKSCLKTDDDGVITLESYPTKIEDTDDWAIFIYNSKLKSKDDSATPKVTGKTSNIFNKIRMKEQSDFEDLGWISNVGGVSKYNLPSFNINVIGGAIKVESTNDTSTGNLFKDSRDKTGVLNELYNLLKSK